MRRLGRGGEPLPEVFQSFRAADALVGPSRPDTLRLDVIRLRCGPNEATGVIAVTVALLVSPRCVLRAQGAPRRIGFLNPLIGQPVRDARSSGLRAWTNAKRISNVHEVVGRTQNPAHTQTLPSTCRYVVWQGSSCEALRLVDARGN